MTATENLRRLLDERGVEWEDCGNGATYVEYNGEAWRFDYDEPFDQLGIVCLSGYTPAQAIAATLGSCNCSNNCTNGERTETCHITRQFTCSKCGHQYPTRNYEYYMTCDGRSAYAPLGYYVLDCKKPNYCPNCGRRIEQ